MGVQLEAVSNTTDRKWNRPYWNFRPSFWVGKNWMQISLFFDPESVRAEPPNLASGAVQVWLDFGDGDPGATGEIRTTRHSRSSNFILIRAACQSYTILRLLWGSWAGDYPLQLIATTL